ncbi:MAG TPA: hypothetical protein DGG95_04865, partial [Cytophagales bacterium]|nr:hypothetical protein [Cytophagales bacterium]
EVVDSYLFHDNQIIIDYKGNIKSLPLPSENIDPIDFGIAELEKEHEFRKTHGYLSGKNPLRYDFNKRYSAVAISGELIKKRYPFNELTELFLNYGPDWDYVKRPDFTFSPTSD